MKTTTVQESRRREASGVEHEATQPSWQRSTRRRFVRGTAAATGGVLAAAYVTPGMRSLGVPRALAVSAPGGGGDGGGGSGTQGCTPGFWGNEGIATAGGKELWNVANDPDWAARRAAMGMTRGSNPNPFQWGTSFNDFFADPAVPATRHPDLEGRVMYVDGPTDDGSIDVNGGAPALKAARQLVAAYLNVSFGLDYPYTTTELKTRWRNAVLSGSATAFENFKNDLDTANNLGCIISGSTTSSPATPDDWTGDEAEKLVRKPKGNGNANGNGKNK